MNKTKAVLILLIPILIGSFLFFKKDEEVGKFDNYEQKIPGWNVYKNEELGYVMEYPENWTMINTHGKYGIVISEASFRSNDYEEKTLERPEGVEGLYWDKQLTKGINLIQRITQIPSDSEWCIGLFEKGLKKCSWREWARRGTDWPYGQITSQGFLTFGGKETYKKEVDYENLTHILISFPDPKEETLFEFIVESLKKDKENNLAILEQIISSLQFSYQGTGQESSSGNSTTTETTTESEENLTPQQVMEGFLEADMLGARLGGEIGTQAPDIRQYKASNFMDPGYDFAMVINDYEIVDQYSSKDNEKYYIKVKYFCDKGIASGYSGWKDEKVIMTVPSDYPGTEGIITSFHCDAFFNPLVDTAIVKYNTGDQTQIITFELIKEYDQWKITSPRICPRISEETFQKHLENFN